MEKQIITFSANEQTLTKTGGVSNYSSNKVSYIEAHFDLGTNWSGYDSVRAIWYNDFKTIATVLNSLGECVVPYEVLTARGKVRVNLVGSISEDDVLTDRITSYPVHAFCVDAVAKVDGSNTDPITPSQFEQFAEAVRLDADRAKTGAESAESSAENALASAQASEASALGASNSASDASDAADRVAQMVAEVIAEIEEFEGVTVTVETLPAGSQATSSFANGVLHLGIPRGDKGEQGEQGERGETGATGATGNGIESITLTSTSGAVKTYTILFTDGTSTTFDVTDGEVTQAVLDETVADLKNGLTNEGVVQGSQGLVSDAKISDSVPYLFRQTADGQRVGNVVYEEIVGGTVAWNQIFGANPSPNTTTKSGVTITRTDGSKYAYSGTSTASSYIDILYSTNVASRFEVGHKYIISSLSTDGKLYVLVNNPYTDLSTNTRKATIFTPTATPTYFYIRLKVTNGESVNGNGVVQVFDLTAMFGTTIADHLYSLEQATAGAGVAVFKKMFPNSYYPYSAGELKSVEGLTSHDCVGFNWFDKTIAVANSRFNGSGTATASGTTRSDYIRCVANITYYFSGIHGASVMGGVFWFDANKNYISHNAIGASSPAVGTATAPANAYYMGINMPNSNVDNVCINISSDRNGQYEPYVKRTYPLDSTLTLRGIPKLSDGKIYYDGDVYKADGTVTRKYGIVDLGTLNWNVSTSNPSQHNSEIVNIKQNTDNIVSAKYLNDPSNRASASSMTDGHMVVNARTIYITSGNGVNPSGYLVYELATPTTETAEPYTSPQIVDRYGTEEYVTTGIVPVGHNSKYSEDLKGKIESLPWDFSTLIAPTETTNKASRNYTTGSLLIMNNILYKVTANIQSGGTITPNTNVTATTLSEVIANL